MLDVSRDRRAGLSCPTCRRPASGSAIPARPFCCPGAPRPVELCLMPDPGPASE